MKGDEIDMTQHSYLSSAERRLLAGWRQDGCGVREIARRLGRSPSTISRELRRNGPKTGAYRAEVADLRYRHRRRRRCVLERDKRLSAYVVDRLTEGWTPEQISGRLKFGWEAGLRRIGVLAIYRWIDRREGEAGQLRRLLPYDSRRRRSQDRIGDKTHLSARSSAADARQEAGHWEGDLVLCKRSQPLLVLHERKTRLTLMTRQQGKTARETFASLTGLLRRLPSSMRGSITFDNDTCFAWHGLLRSLLSVGTFFCDAYASWQKGGVENVNGRIRRWLPRKTDLGEMEESEIQEIVMTMNLTPRKCLGFLTPVEVFLQEIGKPTKISFS